MVQQTLRCHSIPMHLDVPIDERRGLAVCLKDRAERHTKQKRIEKEEYQSTKTYHKSRMACRPNCSKQNPTLTFKPQALGSKCNVARDPHITSHYGYVTRRFTGYCGPACQSEHLKVCVWYFDSS